MLVTGGGGANGTSLSRNEIQNWDCFLPQLRQGPDQARSMAPRGYRVSTRYCCILRVFASLEGQDPGNIVEVCSGQGPDRT